MIKPPFACECWVRQWKALVARVTHNILFTDTYNWCVHVWITYAFRKHSRAHPFLFKCGNPLEPDLYLSPSWTSRESPSSWSRSAIESLGVIISLMLSAHKPKQKTKRTNSPNVINGTRMSQWIPGFKYQYNSQWFCSESYENNNRNTGICTFYGLHWPFYARIKCQPICNTLYFAACRHVAT
jgi:hypothetical protein